MILGRFFVLCIVIKPIVLYLNEKPIAEKIWSGRCFVNERILNDCNWCVCGPRNQFVCTARVCTEVDMFGHFKDTVQEHIVGMEEHGSWRSKATACQPQMHYERNGLLCVCNDEGNWPSPVCRDIFRVLHEIELTGHNQPSSFFKCVPKKLYLFGCNVCLCTESGLIEPNTCTKNKCDENDPVFSDDAHLFKARNVTDVVYAECELNRKYIVGCQSCICLKNNRLVCDENCREDLRTLQNEPDLCSKYAPNQIFDIDCNTCTCGQTGTMICTTKLCLKHYLKPSVELSKTVDLNLRVVEPPLNGNECVPGTKYKDDCNTCFCSKNSSGKRVLSCTLKTCKRKATMLNKLTTDCVENTVYEQNCLICRCDAIDGVKRESCEVNSECKDKKMNVDIRSPDLKSLHGYCEPMHTYKKDCNTCQCLPNGKLVSCTSKVCKEETEKPIIVELVPVSQKGIVSRCVAYRTYKVDCNLCFCLADGNVICTTSKCF